MGLFSGFSGSNARKKRHHGNGSGYYKQQSGMGRPVRRHHGLFRVRQFRQAASRRFRFRLVKLQQTAPCGIRHPLPRAAGACAGRSADRLGEQRFDLPELSRRRSGRGKILPRVRHETRRRLLRPVRRHVAPDRQILP